jgi:hypothetical protein
MPRVVPSQVVRYIDQVFPWASNSQAKPAQLDFTHSGRVSAIVALAQSVPKTCSISTTNNTRTSLPRWRCYEAGFPCGSNVVARFRHGAGSPYGGFVNS